MLKFRDANINDLDTYFKWANDLSVRKQSYNSNVISLVDHRKWFKSKLEDKNCEMYIFYDTNDVGQVRFQITTNFEAVISISIDENSRGKGYGVKMLNYSTENFHKKFPNCKINAYIKIENFNSKSIFEKANFNFKGFIDFETIKSYHYVKYEN